MTDVAAEFVRDPLSSRITAEWDWVVLPEWNRLHAPRKWDDPTYNAYDEEGETECGRTGWVCIPGVFARMATLRCAHCCRATGMPRGQGSPKNDDACRPIAERRIAALSEAP